MNDKSLDELYDTEGFGVIIISFLALDAVLAGLCWWKFGGHIAAIVGGIYLAMLAGITWIMADVS